LLPHRLAQLTRTSKVLGVLAVAAAAAAAPVAGRAAEPARARAGAPRILHVMSYHSPWRWTDGQLQGFQEGLQGVRAQYRVFQMDTKRNSTPEAKEGIARQARALIEQWKPDLVYTSDDDAQEYVVKPFVNGAIPFVFSGVNRDPGVYGFTDSKNVTGVLEQEHFVESVQLLTKIAPRVRRIAVVFDDAAMWEPVRRRMEAAVAAMPGLEFGPWDVIRTFDEYQRKVRAYHGAVDAIALVGIFNFRDAAGKNVPYQDVLRWTAEHSTLPDFSFWIDRVHHGTLCAVTVSEREQGLAAGRIARAILVEGKRPGSIPVRPTVRGLPVVNLARARALGLMPATSVLLSAQVIQTYDWDPQR
jgi:ABC-type uncharacterized transport system substrate-binding protein